MEHHKDYVIYACSRTSQSDTNKASDFTIQLERPIELDERLQWECCLVDFDFQTSTHSGYYICLDIIESSPAGDFALPVIRRLRLSRPQFHHLIYRPIIRSRFDAIRVYFRNWKNKQPMTVRGTTFCTLHIRPIKNSHLELRDHLGMRDSFYAYLSSRDCKLLFPQNFNGEQKVQLAEPIHLEGHWTCALVEFVLSAAPQEPVYICCHLVTDSTCGQFSLPLLRQVDRKSTEFAELIYVPLAVTSFQTIHVFVRTLENRPLPRASGINSGDSSCALHFKRRDVRE